MNTISKPERQAQESYSYCPTMADLKADMVRILSEYANDRQRWPEMMPRDPHAAASWLKKLFREPSPREAPRRHKMASGIVWEWPYMNRMMYLTEKFLYLDKDFQNYIFAARQDGTCWEGDSYEDFIVITNESETMREMGAEAYIKNAISFMKSVIRKMG